MRLRTIHMVVCGGVYHAPGTTIEIGSKAEVERLVALGAARVEEEGALSESVAQTNTDAAAMHGRRKRKN